MVKCHDWQLSPACDWPWLHRLITTAQSSHNSSNDAVMTHCVRPRPPEAEPWSRAATFLSRPTRRRRWAAGNQRPPALAAPHTTTHLVFTTPADVIENTDNTHFTGQFSHTFEGKQIYCKHVLQYLNHSKTTWVDFKFEKCVKEIQKGVKRSSMFLWLGLLRVARSGRICLHTLSVDNW